jgi:hypothetical protein
MKKLSDLNLVEDFSSSHDIVLAVVLRVERPREIVNRKKDLIIGREKQKTSVCIK